MAVTTQKTASWGVGTTSPITGVITDYEDSCEATLAPEQNEVGSVIQQTMYDKHWTASCTVQVASDANKPKAGAAISIGGRTMYVTSARYVENNTSYRKISIQAECYEHCTATTAASGISTGS